MEGKIAQVMRDPRLSLKAKGMYGLMATFSKDSIPRQVVLESYSQDGNYSLTKAVAELKEFGYVRYELLKKDGKILGKHAVLVED